MRDLVVIAIVVLSSIVALRRPIFGILAYTCFAYTNPNALAWTFGRDLPVAMLPAVGTLLGFLFWDEAKNVPKQPEVRLLLLLWGTFTVSTLFAIDFSSSLDSYLRISKVLFMTLLTTVLVNNPSRLQWFLRVISIPLGFLALKTALFVFKVSGQASTIMGPAGTWLEGNNTLGLVFVINVPILFCLIKLESSRWLKFLLIVMLIGSYPAVAYTYTRGAWLGLVAVSFMMFAQLKRKMMWGLAAGCLCIMAIPFIPGRLQNRYQTLENYQEDNSSQSRLWNWEFCVRVAMDRPLTGGGFGVYSLQNYARYYPEFLDRFPGKVWSAHSIWFSVLGEHGWIGLFIWIALLLSCHVGMFRLRQRLDLSVSSNMPAAHYSWMINSALVGYMVSGSFVDAEYFEILYHLVAAAIITKQIWQPAEMGRSLGVKMANVDSDLSRQRRELSFQ